MISFPADGWPEDEPPSIPLVRPWLPDPDEIIRPLSRILKSGRLTNFGPYSKAMEAELCDYLGVKHALCVSSATTGLTILFSTLPEGSEVIVPSFTFLPTIQALLWNSIVPVFADIGDDYTISVDSAAELINSRTSAIVGVHAFGNPCSVEALSALAEKHDLRLFFDAAHAIGAKYRERHVGGGGNAEVFSFSATKLLSCGEGGAIVTNDKDIYHAMLDRCNYGFAYNSYDCGNRGLNGKISEFSAILGLWGLEYQNGIRRIDRQVARRNEIASKYRSVLSEIPGLGFQRIDRQNISCFKDFTVTVDSRLFGRDRSDVRASLRKAGIETASYFSPAVHRMDYFKNHPGLKYDSLDRTVSVEQSILSVPIYYGLSDEDVSKITECFFHRPVTGPGD